MLKLNEIYYSVIALERLELWQSALWLRFIRVSLVSCSASLLQRLISLYLIERDSGKTTENSDNKSSVT